MSQAMLNTLLVWLGFWIGILYMMLVDHFTILRDKKNSDDRNDV